MSNLPKVIAVIGGGPAGAMAAEKLSRAAGTHAVVFEEKLGWEKPCGGGLSRKALRRYPFLVEAAGQCRRISSTEFVATNGAAARFPLLAPLAIYSRRTLNHLLLRRAEEAGAEVVQDRILDLRRSGTKWELVGRKGNYTAEFVVLAGGARSRLRRLLLEDCRPQDFMLTFGYYVPLQDELMRVQFYEDFEGYAWSFPRPDHLSVGICGKVGEDRMAGLRERLHDFMAHFGYSTGQARIFSHVLPSLSVESWNNLRLVGREWALAGDAAGLVDPVTGEGIYYAMRSGELLADALLEGEPVLYAQRVREEFGRALELGARLADTFYRGHFLGGSVTTHMVEFGARSRRFQLVLQEMLEGSRSYAGYATQIYVGLTTTFFEIARNAFREALVGAQTA